MSELKKSISNFAGITLEELESIVNKAQHSYKRYYIPKNSGGQRRIHHPSSETKLVQYVLINILFNKLPVHDLATAYREEVSIRDNVEYHKDYEYSIRMDFRNFFPSIKFEDIKLTLEASDLSNQYSLSEEEYELIRKACFTKETDGLAVGAPCSPTISNTVMYDFDTELYSIVKGINPDSVFTRYADDIVFSTNKEGECKEFENKLESLVGDLDNPNLSVHEDKTYYMSRGNKRMVTGLIITPDGKISIGRDKKRYIKKLVFDYTKDEIDEEELKYLTGYISYILDVEPTFYNSLVQKYSAETLKMIKEEAFQ